jgi:GR25 family glycosyltransferase involved in LPS biosynthesis
MVYHIMISLKPSTPNVETFKTWCTRHDRENEIIPGRRITSLAEAKPFLTSYGYYIMCNWRESASHFDSTGPIGCFLAHRDVWIRCIDRNEHVWVFEEGVHDYDTLMFEQIDRDHPTTDLIMAHTVPLLRMWKQKRSVKQDVDSRLPPIDKIYYGTKCYRLSPGFAQVLLDNSQTFDTHVDTYICTEAIQHADTYTVARTHRNIVSARSSGTINHSIDHSLLISMSMFVGILLSILCIVLILRLYRRCRTYCKAPTTGRSK